MCEPSISYCREPRPWRLPWLAREPRSPTRGSLATFSAKALGRAELY
jgi:hypothetical protein